MKKQLIAAAVVGAIAGAGYLGLVHTEGAAFDAAFNDAVADLDELARANIVNKIPADVGAAKRLSNRFSFQASQLFQ